MKWIKLLSISLFASCITMSYAQETKKSVKIVTKTIDKDGNETVKEQYAEGEEAEKLLKEMDIEVEEGGQIRVEVETDGDKRKKVKVRVENEREIIKGEENDIKINIDQDGDDRFTLRMDRNGEEEVFNWEGLDNLPEELEQMLEDMDLKLNLEDLELGDIGGFKMKTFDLSSNYGRAALGVRIEDDNIQKGATVVEVAPNSAAELAGLKKGDIITYINGIAIESTDQLIRKIGKYEPKERIEVEYKRNGKSKKTKVILKERTL